ncbi:hypothetical protein D3C87_687480 [compost metagenome]
MIMPTSSSREVTSGKFDGNAFYEAIRSAAFKRAIPMGDVATETGVSTATLSRMKKVRGGTDVVSFLALCHWANVNPLTFWLPTAADEVQERPTMQIFTEILEGGINDVPMSADSKILGFSDTPGLFYLRTLQRVDDQGFPANVSLRRILVVVGATPITDYSFDQLRPIPGFALCDGDDVSAFEVIKI